MRRWACLLPALFLAAIPGVFPADASPPDFFLPGDSLTRGESAMAERYALWAKNAIDQGRWSEALAGLERASDFADVSSDISCLLALARSHENKGRGPVLQALEKALRVNHWKLYHPDTARLLKADNLIAVRAYNDALAELSRVSRGPREAVLSLRALMPVRPAEFLRYMADTLDRYPRESGPVRVFFNYLDAKNRARSNPGTEDLQLLELIIRRLPVLLINNPDLAWIAAPFMRDSAEAKRLVSAYRAVRSPDPSSLPAALRLGVIDEETAIEELFAVPAAGSKTADTNARPDEQRQKLDRGLLDDVWNLLRREEVKQIFTRNLSAYMGVIIEDADRDGIPETSAEYSGGLLTWYTYDADQDGISDLTVYFEGGNPLRARLRIPPVNSAGITTWFNRPDSPDPVPPAKEAAVRWERYPAILEVEMDGATFIPRPLDFYFSPLKFDEPWGSGLLFPRRDPLSPPLTRRLVVFSSIRAVRPSLEFSGGIEIVELNQGIPVRAREYVGNLMVSETEFLRGRPQIQRVDTDLDGRMETGRFFKRNYRPMELEDLWNYDRDIDRTVTDWDKE
ncbi:MAG: hypothetical protein FWC45_06000 [Treponema sp.]|nr:hypothetical protein [Treponema sp.]